jgi:hypothetical protein
MTMGFDRASDRAQATQQRRKLQGGARQRPKTSCMAMARYLRYERVMRTILLGLVLLVACGTNRHQLDADPGDSSGEGGGGEVCGGFFPRPCAATEYCDYPDNDCGIADQTGICRPRPVVCPPVLGRPICGCDGMVHSDECSTYTTGTDLDANGGCPHENTLFGCGYTLCDLATEYCRRERPPSGPEGFACVALPSACTGSAATCTCLRGERCGASCAGDAKLGLTLTCP